MPKFAACFVLWIGPGTQKQTQPARGVRTPVAPGPIPSIQQWPAIEIFIFALADDAADQHEFARNPADRFGK